MQLNIYEARRRVHDHGAPWLDEFMEGWAERVSVARLRTASSCDCVLGQIVASEGVKGGFFAGERFEVCMAKA